MPNAKDIDLSPARLAHRILVLGDTGSGKTTQFATLPGKKFAYLFDPSAILSLRGQDIDYEEFLPSELDLKLTSLTKDRGDIKKSSEGAEAYRAWEKDFDEKFDGGFFDKYENIMMDSSTTFLDMIMDGVLAINSRGGQWPQQDDYGPQMITFHKVVRAFVSMGKRVYFTAHYNVTKDEVLGRVFRLPMMTGRLVRKIPLLFSEVLSLEAVADGSGKVVYRCQTKPDRLTPNIRTSIKGLEPFEDVTIDFNKPLEGQGLGRLLTKGK